MYDCATGLSLTPLIFTAILLFSADPRTNAQIPGEKQLGEDTAKAMEKKFSELEKYLKDLWSKPAPEISVKPAISDEEKKIRLGEKPDSPESRLTKAESERKPGQGQPDFKERVERCTVQVVVKGPFQAATRTGLGTAIEAYQRGESESQIIDDAENAAIERFKKEEDITLESPKTRVVDVLKCVVTNGVGNPVRAAFERCAWTAVREGQTGAEAVHCFSQALLK
jgi:hypothetical protein